MPQRDCSPCRIAITEYGSSVCVVCGQEDFRGIWTDRRFDHSGAPIGGGTYTRMKRFRKYINRTGMHQSVTCVPDDTWRYLLENRPYSGPGAIVRALKKLKKSRKKCYDCLPLLTSVLCPNISVPILTERDKFDALNVFRKVDHCYLRGMPLISYMYVLEYILEHIGRSDMLPFIHKVQCKKRRRLYRARLDDLIQNGPQTAGTPVAPAVCAQPATACYTPEPSALGKAAARVHTLLLGGFDARPLLVASGALPRG